MADINWSEWSRIKYYNDDEIMNIKKRYERLFKHYKINTKKMTLLEIGCGHGVRTLVYEKLFKKILAIDPEKKLINIFNKKIEEEKLDKKIQTKISNCENFVSKKKFDMAICSYSFMWVTDKQKCLLNINNSLKKNGYLLVLEPAKFMNFLKKEWKNREVLMIDTLQTLIRSRKFKLLHFMNLYKGNFTYLLKKV